MNLPSVGRPLAPAHLVRGGARLLARYRRRARAEEEVQLRARPRRAVRRRR